MNSLVTKFFKRSTLMMASLVLAVGGLSAAAPLFLSRTANAAPNTVYTSTNFEDLSLSPDRQAPYTYSTTPTSLTENVDNTKANTSSTFYQSEGLKGTITSSKSIEAQLYIDPTWSGKKVQAGLWGVTSSTTEAGNAWPIIQYSTVSDGGFVGFRVFDTMNGGWSNLDGIAATPGQIYTLEIAYNSSTENYDYYVNDVLVLSKTAMDGTNTFNSFTGVIFDNYNFATGNSADNYNIKWSNFSRGTSPTVADTNIAYVNGATGSDSNDGVTAQTAFKTIQHALNAVTTGGTVHIADGSYTEKISLTKGGVTIDGQSTAGTIIHPLINAYGQGFTSEGYGDVTMNDLSIQVTNKVTNGGYALKFHNAQNISLNNVTVSATSGSSMGGIDFSSVSGIQLNNVSSSGFSKNGIAFTSKYANSDSYQTSAVSLNNISSTNNGWVGVAFYNVGGGGAALDINNVLFSGTNTITGNGQSGIYFEGGSDAQFGSGAAPTYSVTGPSDANVNLGNTTLSGNALNIVNFQTKDVMAGGAVINGKVGNDMSASELQTAELSVIDQADNATYGKVILDSVAPVTPTNLLPADGTYTNNPNFSMSWNASPTATVYEYRTSYSKADVNTLGAIIYTDSSATSSNYIFSPTTITRANNGTPQAGYYWQVRAGDAAGNWSDWSAINLVTVDTTAPVPTIVTPTNNLSVTGTVAITTSDVEANPSINYITVTNNLTHVSTTLLNDNTAIQNPTVNWDTTSFAEGTYTIYYEVKDKAGNDTAASTVTATVDHTKPTITVKPGYVGDINTKIFSNVSFSLYDANKVDKYVINGYTSDFTNNLYSDANFQNIKSHLVQGTNTLTLYDVAGNTTTYSFTYDSIAPIPSILTPTNGQPINGTVAITTNDAEAHPSVNFITVTNDTTHVSTTLLNDNTGIQSPTLNWDTTTYADGTYTIYYEVKDVAGNDTAASTVNVIVDHTAPTINVNPINTTTNPPAITGTVDDVTAVVTVSLTINGTITPLVVTQTGLTWSANVPAALADGTYTVTATATDSANNFTTQTVPMNVATITNPSSQTTPAVSTTTTTTGTPTTTTGTNQGAAPLGTPAVLGTSTTNTPASTTGASDVKGASTQKTTDNSSAWTLAWYWWVLIIAAIAGFIWWLIARRRRNQEA